MKLGAIQEATGIDIGHTLAMFPGRIDGLFELSHALLTKRREDAKR